MSREMTTEELKMAITMLREGIIDSADLIEEPKEPLSREFEMKMWDAMKIHRKQTAWKRVLKRVAVVLLALGVGFGSVLTFSEPARAAVYEWFRTVTNGRIDYWFQIQDADELLPEIKLGYIPDGYDETKHVADEESGDIQIELYNGESEDYIWININQLGKVDVIDLYSEKDHTQKVFINEIEGDYYEDENGIMNNLVWVDESNGLVFMVDSPLEKNEILKIAKSITVTRKIC